MNDNDDLIYRKSALMKRRVELLEQLCDCADRIKKIDDELEQSHCLDGIDSWGDLRSLNHY
jgi:hypothetical protein